VYVGAGQRDSTGGKEVNDICIASATTEPERYFMIAWRPEQRDFYIVDLEKGTGTFARIDAKLRLLSGQIISFGDTHMFITIGHDSKIQLKFIDGPRQDTVLEFTTQDTEISIGRMPDCTIRFEDSSLSRYQCTIYYEEFWSICDGNRGKNSTNGTWVFTDSPYTIHDHMTFKSANKMFEIEFL
jgi:hypothetical protein